MLGGKFDPDRRRPDGRADPRPANEAGEPRGRDDSDASPTALSSASSDVSGAGDRREGSVKMLSPLVEREWNLLRNVYPSPSNRQAS